MGSRSLLLSRTASAPRALKHACCLAALAMFCFLLFPSQAAAQTCPGQVSGTYTLTGNLAAVSGGTNPCISVGADGTTILLSGYTIDVSALGDGGVAISTGSFNNVTVSGNGATIVTAYSTVNASQTAAIETTGGTNLTITGVTLNNEVNGALCQNSRTDESWGTGISVDGVTGATISGNNAYCYQTGISVQNSAITRRGTGSISGNTLEQNIYDMATGTSGVYSAGLVLSNSSGWTVNGNTVDYNGSYDSNQGCTSNPPSLISCSFGLQVINASSGNTIESNTVNNNFIGGIYAGPDTSKNLFSSNTALYNFWDIYDDAPLHSNSWRKNTCSTAGGSLLSVRSAC